METAPALQPKSQEAQLCDPEQFSPTVSSLCCHMFNVYNNIVPAKVSVKINEVHLGKKLDFIYNWLLSSKVDGW